MTPRLPPSAARATSDAVMRGLWCHSSVSPDRWTEDAEMALLQTSPSLLLCGQAIWGVGESVQKHLLSMEDLSFSLREAKPKHFGLETFAVVLEPCLLASQLCPREPPSHGDRVSREASP